MRPRRSVLRKRSSRRATLEHLETRRLLAILSVSPSSPFTTVQSAVDHARSGDVILIAEGIYQGNVDFGRMGISVGGTPGSLVLRGDNDGQTIIESPGGSALSNSVPFHGDLSLEHLSIRPGVAATAGKGLALQDYTGDLYVTDVEFLDLAEGGIELNGASGRFSVVDSVFRDLGSSADDVAIRVADFAGIASISGNVIEDAAGTAISLENSAGQVASLMIDDNTVLGEETFFSTTRSGFVVSLGGDSRTDLTLDNNSLESLADAAVDVRLSGTASLHTRWSRNVAGNLDGSAALQFELRNNAQADVEFWQNTVIDASGDGLVISLANAAALDGVIRENQFISIGDAAGDDALTIESDADSSARLNVSLHKNDFLTVAGMGAHLSAGGSSLFQAGITENFFSEANTQDGGSAFLAEQATADGTADLLLKLADNDVVLSAGTAYSLRYRGSGDFDLEGTEADAASQIAVANTGQPIVVSGSVAVVPLGSLDDVMPQRIGGRIWLDFDNNGLQDGDEAGMAGMILTIAGSETVSGNSVARTTQSDSDGYYAFVGLSAGQYTVTLEMPSGHPLADPDQGSDDSLDSDFAELDADTASATASLAAGSGELTLDAGLLRSWQNPRVPHNLYQLDVNNDGFVTAVDALILINDLNSNGNRRLSDWPETAPTAPPFLDVDGNGIAAPLDVLLVISYLNSTAGIAVSPQGEGEPDDDSGAAARAKTILSGGDPEFRTWDDSLTFVMEDALAGAFSLE